MNFFKDIVVKFQEEKKAKEDREKENINRSIDILNDVYSHLVKSSKTKNRYKLPDVPLYVDIEKKIYENCTMLSLVFSYKEPFPNSFNFQLPPHKLEYVSDSSGKVKLRSDNKWFSNTDQVLEHIEFELMKLLEKNY